MADPLEDYLRRSPLTQAQRADVWDAYQNSADQDALTAALKPLKIPNEVKAGLWDMKAPKVKDPFAGQELRNAPPAPEPTLTDKAKVLAMRSATGGMFSDWDSASNWFFGTKERNEMQAQGYGMAAPTPAQMVEMPLTLLGPELAPALLPVAGAERAAGAGRMARLASNPKVLAGAEGALPGILHRDPKQAIEGAAAGVLLGHVLTRNRRAVPIPDKPPEVPPSAPRTAPEPLSAKVEPVVAPEPVAPAIEAPAAPPTKIDPGKLAAQNHAANVAFAKEAARTNPKIGAKIWIELDEAGRPVRVLTPDGAAAAKRAGKATTWVKNLWQ